MMYTVFASAVVELRKLITSPPELNFTRAKSKIIDGDDVQFYWSMVSSNWVEEVASVLLEMMIDKYVKIRGHSTASAWLEQYKRESKNHFRNQKVYINNSFPRAHQEAVPTMILRRHLQRTSHVFPICNMIYSYNDLLM